MYLRPIIVTKRPEIILLHITFIYLIIKKTEKDLEVSIIFPIFVTL